MPLWAEVFHTSEHRAYSLPLADMQTIDTIDEYNSRRRHARSTTFKFTLGQQEAPVSNPQRREAPPCNNWEDWSRRGCWQRQEHSEDFYQIPLPQAKEITSHPLFLPPPPLREGLRLTHRNPPVQRLQLRLPLELPCPFPGPAAARPAHTNGAYELLKSFLRALFLRSRSQRPPVATCQSQGLITCAGLGAAHSSPASPCKMLTSGRWAPRPPAGSTEGTRGGGKTWPTCSAGTDKKHRKMEKEVARNMSVQLRAASGHTACPTPGWTLMAAWKLWWNKDIRVCVDLLR